MRPRSGERERISGERKLWLRGRRLNVSTAFDTVGVLSFRRASSVSGERFMRGFCAPGFSRSEPHDQSNHRAISRLADPGESAAWTRLCNPRFWESAKRMVSELRSPRMGPGGAPGGSVGPFKRRTLEMAFTPERTRATAFFP